MAWRRSVAEPEAPVDSQLVLGPVAAIVDIPAMRTGRELIVVMLRFYDKIA